MLPIARHRSPAPAAQDPAPTAAPRGGSARLGCALALVLTMMLSACSGDETDNSNCGSEGNTRELHCAP